MNEKNGRQEDAEEFRAGLYNEVIVHMRQKHPELIDAAYDYFWEDEYPEDFLSGLPLELGFVNFEDWFICDYNTPETGFVTDLYLKETGQEEDKEKSAALGALKRSFISLYDVKSAGGGAELEDALLGSACSLKSVPLDGLEAGGLFATRIISLAGRHVMGACIYPFGGDPSVRQSVFDSIDSQFARYKKNKNPGGALEEFLKQESYIFNVIWTSGLYRKS